MFDWVVNIPQPDYKCFTYQASNNNFTNIKSMILKFKPNIEPFLTIGNSFFHPCIQCHTTELEPSQVFISKKYK